MGALALKGIAVMAHQGVELVSQGSQFARIGPEETFRPPRPEVRDLVTEGEERPQPQPDLDHHRRNQACCQKDEDHRGRGEESPHIRIDGTPVLGRQDDHRCRIARQDQPRGANPELLARGPGNLIAESAGGLGLESLRQTGRCRQLEVPEGPGPGEHGADVAGPGPQHLPVAT
jgi:hypothetical protein